MMIVATGNSQLRFFTNKLITQNYEANYGIVVFLAPQNPDYSVLGF